MDINNIKIINLPSERWAEYKNLRLEALKNAPTAFDSTYEEYVSKPDEYWQQKLIEYQGQVGEIYFAKNEGKLIGMAGVDFNSKPKRKHAVSLVAIYVNPDYRGKGVASLMLKTMLEKIEKRPGVIKLDLDVNTKNQSAIKLYQKFGFKIVGTYQKDLYYDGVYYDLYEMEKILI